MAGVAPAKKHVTKKVAKKGGKRIHKKAGAKKTTGAKRHHKKAASTDAGAAAPGSAHASPAKTHAHKKPSVKRNAKKAGKRSAKK